jgi:MraZ protein
MNRLFGEHRHLIDAKGRLFMPVRLLKVLGETFFVSVSKAKCLNVYTLGEWEKLEEKFNGLEEDEEMVSRRKFYSMAQDCTPDSQGRVMLKPELRKYAGLTKNVVIAGAGKYAEIWDADEWERSKS